MIKTVETVGMYLWFPLTTIKIVGYLWIEIYDWFKGQRSKSYPTRVL